MVRVRPSSLAFAALSVASGLAALSALANGCALPSFTLAPVVPDAGSDAPVVPTGCMEATYPDPPGGMDDGVAIPGLVFAVHTIDMGDNGDTPGYDLDNVCTCFDDAGSSCSGASPQLSTYCDAPGGVDNQAAKLFQLIELPLGPGLFGSDFFSSEANQGAWSLLIYVQGYNGELNDPFVTVSLFPSPGLGGKAPAWNGSDKWPVTAESVGDGGLSNPLFNSNGGYVSGGVLVATLPTSELTLAGGSGEAISVRLSAGVLTAHIAMTNGVWSLKNGVIAARWALADVFKSLSTYRDNNGNPICTNQISYTFAKSTVCNDADILVDGTQPKSAPCDALSIGLGFTADPAVLGDIADAGAVSDGCSPATDPANDTCPPP
jgi:hypothetical protein